MVRPQSMSECRGRLVRSDPPSTALRSLQHRAFADAEWCRAWAARVVVAKIDTQLQAARHYQRDADDAVAVLEQLFAQVRTDKPRSAGYETFHERPCSSMVFSSSTALARR